MISFLLMPLPDFLRILFVSTDESPGVPATGLLCSPKEGHIGWHAILSLHNSFLLLAATSFPRTLPFCASEKQKSAEVTEEIKSY